MMKLMTVRRASVLSAVLACSLLTACAHQQQQTATPYHGSQQYGSQGSYPVNQPVSQRDQSGYEYGRVTYIEVLQSHERGRTTGAGAVLGAVVGGLLGNQIGNGTGRSVATAAGVVGGAVAGNAIEGNTQQGGHTTIDGYRVSIQVEGSGATRVFDVPDPGDLRNGDRVRIRNGQISRLN